jgi:hypothetical protein
MIYDALQYVGQVSKISAVHLEESGYETMSSAEF